jgi:hypothetical protein
MEELVEMVELQGIMEIVELYQVAAAEDQAM